MEDAIKMGIPLTVIGNGWRGIVPESQLEARRIPHNELAAYYKSARIVFADHWPEMARDGFIQNRIFDAVACGCRVISDYVTGMEDYFDGAVRCYRNLSELKYLCASDSTSLFPSELELAEIGWKIARNESFKARALTLKSAVDQWKGHQS